MVASRAFDTRASDQGVIRDAGAPNGTLGHSAEGKIDIEARRNKAAAWPASKAWT